MPEMARSGYPTEESGGHDAHRRRTRRRAGWLLGLGGSCATAVLVSMIWQFGVFVNDNTIVAASSGTIGVYWYKGTSPLRVPNPMVSWAGPLYAMPVRLRFQWWFYVPESPAMGGLGVPLWAPTVGLLIPGWVLWRRTSVPAGHCRACRYNLAGLPAGAPCPECGSGQAPEDAA